MFCYNLKDDDIATFSFPGRPTFSISKRLCKCFGPSAYNTVL